MNFRLREALRGIDNSLIGIRVRHSAWELERARGDLKALVENHMCHRLAEQLLLRFRSTQEDKVEYVDFEMRLYALTPEQLMDLMLRAYGAGYTDRPIVPELKP